MKNRLKPIALIAAVICFAACEKNNEVRHERNITYTVDAQTVTVYLTTEAEWDALLDQFCDYAEGGSSVTFRNANSAAKSATKEAITYSTTDREAMKRWMARMEDEGKTVTVTYDSQTGIWSGTAYATAPLPVSGAHTFVCDYWPDYIAIVTVDPTANRCYGTWGHAHVWSLYGLPWGICSYTTTRYTCQECPQEYHLTNIYWNGIDVGGTCQMHGDTLHVECGGMLPQCTTCIGMFDLVRSTQYETWVSTNNGYDVVLHIDRANHVAVASTPADYINTVVDFPQGRFHYEDDEYGNRQTYLSTYPPVLDTTSLYGEAYNIYQTSPTQEEWRLICDCLNPPTFIFNRIN